MTLPPDLNRALVDLYRGWDRLEREQFGSSIIDFDLAASAPVPGFRDRQAVRDELRRLAQALADGDDAGTILARARVRASIAYLEAVMGVEVLPFSDYVLATMGIKAAMVPDRHIGESALRLRLLFRNVPGLEGVPFSRSGHGAFREEFQLQTGVNLENQFEYFREKWVAPLARAIDTAFDPSAIVVEFANEDAYWKNWISGNVAEGEPIKLRINVHERHVWYQGSVEILVLHEYCGHAVQMALWHEAVRRATIAGFFGILTVHFPDQFLLEGLAESIAHVLPDDHREHERAEDWSGKRGRHELERRSEVIRELQRYNLLVLNNVHILANDEGVDAARAYARQRLHFTSDETIERELRDRTQHPLFRTYQYVYAPAKETFLGALKPMPPPARWPILRQLYRTPLTPAGVCRVLGVSGDWTSS